MNHYKNILEIKDLCVSIDGKQILNDLNLVIPEGEVHALLGKNGSGKTTLIQTIMGFSKYHIVSGEILYKGENINELSIPERAQIGIAIAQQRPPSISGVKLKDILEFMLRDNPEPEHMLHALTSKTQTKEFLKRSINVNLSGGEIKRVELLQLLTMRPFFSMMDEPDSGIDIEALNLIGNLLQELLSKKENLMTSGIIITHSGQILNYLNIDKAHIMDQGKIKCSGKPDVLLNKIKDIGYESCIREMEGRL